jgi:hypothetical protein
MRFATMTQFIHRQAAKDSSIKTAWKDKYPYMLVQKFGTTDREGGIGPSTLKIPCRPGQFYGIGVVPDFCTGLVNMKLRLTMPYPRKHWKGDLTMVGQTNAMTISDDNKTATYEANFETEGINTATWTVDNEDKPGVGKLDIYLNDHLTKSFVFELVDK